MKYATTPCLETGCYEIATYQGRCDTHKRPAWEGSTRKKRLPPDWETRRRIILNRSNVCYLCGEAGADTVDHVNQSLEDDHSLENLAPVHDRVYPHCHRYKTSMEANQAKKNSFRN